MTLQDWLDAASSGLDADALRNHAARISPSLSEADQQRLAEAVERLPRRGGALTMGGGA
jgi:hypothetical protein